MLTGNLNVFTDARFLNIISKCPKYRFTSNIDFPKCRREIAASLDDFSNRWCKRENVEPDTLKEWNINILPSRREISASLNDFINRWCKRENAEPDTSKEWKINIFKMIDSCISFYSHNTDLIPLKPKSSLQHLK